MVGLAVLIVAYILIAPALGISALRLSLRQRGEVAALRLQVGEMRRELTDLRGGTAEGPEEAPTETAESLSVAPTTEFTPRQDSTSEASPSAKSPLPATSPPPAAPANGLAAFEESLASRWLVWLGALTLALGGSFLIKYSIDQGWLRPAVRISLGLLLGGLLAAGGEWVRRRPLSRSLAKVRPDYVPPALTAAGVFIAFASAYAAYALYGLLTPILAFALLAAIAAGAIALALRQGPFVALLGILGGYLTPFLVQSDAPAVWPLFGYLLVLTGGGLSVLRLKSWWWLGWATLAGSLLWPLFWLAAAWTAKDVWPLAVYLLALTGLFLPMLRSGDAAEPLGPPRWLADLPPQDRIAWGAALGGALLAFVLVRMDAYGPVSLVALGLFCICLLAAGRQQPAWDGFAVVGALLGLAVIAAWHLPEIVTQKQVLYSIAGRGYGSVPGPIVPPELLPFTATATALGALFGIGGYLLLWGSRRPGLWAAVSATTPIYLLAIAYWRITAFEVDLLWGTVSFALAGLALAAAMQIERHRGQDGFGPALAAYAVAAVAAISLAATMTLEQAWLTVALSLQLPALAWVHGHLKERPLRVLAGLVAAVVLVRLAFNPFVLDYPLGGLPGINWILYGYGLPAAAFYAAAHIFRRQGSDNRLVTLLEAGALAFAVLVISLEIRNLVVGPLGSSEHPLLEQSLQSIAWLVIALGLRRVSARSPRPAAVWGAHILAALAAAQVLLLQVFGSNPMITGDPLAGPLGFNTLTLAYLAPAALGFALEREYRRTGSSSLASIAGLAGLGLIFVYLSLEVRHLFHGAYLAGGVTSNAELYTYSLVWLGYAAALLALALKTERASLRYVSLGFLLITVAKVFLIDMGSLTGLYRVASFLGLGLSLVGIGYLYQRYVFPAVRPSGTPEARMEL